MDEKMLNGILEEITICQGTDLTKLSTEEVEKLKNDLEDKKQKLNNELSRLYKNGANVIDDFYILNPIEEKIEIVEELLENIEYLQLDFSENKEQKNFEKEKSIAEEISKIEDEVQEVAEEIPEIEDEVEEIVEEVPVIEDEVEEIVEEVPVIEDEVEEIIEEVQAIEDETQEVIEEIPEIEDEVEEIIEEVPTIEYEIDEIIKGVLESEEDDNEELIEKNDKEEQSIAENIEEIAKEDVEQIIENKEEQEIKEENEQETEVDDTVEEESTENEERIEITEIYKILHSTPLEDYTIQAENIVQRRACSNIDNAIGNSVEISETLINKIEGAWKKDCSVNNIGQTGKRLV